mgnify:CR=1 FL=1|tara:strand:+ start:702 stop:1349 length:648 start_codon:yes stop_codon:yes gene_type:complete
MSRFPLPENYNSEETLTVDKLKELYEGIAEEVDTDLINASIAPRLDRPEIPDGLDDVISFSTVRAESPNGESKEVWVDPQEPSDLTELTDIALGKAFSFFTRWTNYVQSETTRAKGILRIAKRTLKVTEAALKTYYKEVEGTPANQVSDRMALDPRWAEIDLAVLKAEVFMDKADARYENYRRILNNISREQTRRAEDIKDSRTDAAFGWRRSRP